MWKKKKSENLELQDVIVKKDITCKVVRTKVLVEDLDTSSFMFNGQI